MNKKIRLLYVKVKKYVIFSKILDHRRRTTDKMTIKIGRDHYWIILHPLWTGEVVKLSRSYRISNIWSYLDMNVFRKIKFDTGSTLAKTPHPYSRYILKSCFEKVLRGIKLEVCTHLYPLHTPGYLPGGQKLWKLGVLIIFWTVFKGGSKVENDESDDVPLTFTRNPVGALGYIYRGLEIRAGLSLIV